MTRTPDNSRPGGIYDPAAAAAASPWARRLNYVQDALLVVVSAVFFYYQALGAIEGSIVNAGFAAEQAILVAMFLTRRRSRATSSRPFDWIVATGGWLPLLARPHEAEGSLALAGAITQAGGLGLTCAAMLSLGRSFGVVAANRGLKVHGPYRFVRHPVYLAHTVTFIGFVMANPTPWNAGIGITTLMFQVFRMRAEERVLAATSEYSEYRKQVRWRLLPGVY